MVFVREWIKRFEREECKDSVDIGASGAINKKSAFPTVETLEKIAKAFDVQVGDLFNK